MAAGVVIVVPWNISIFCAARMDMPSLLMVQLMSNKYSYNIFNKNSRTIRN